MVFIFICGNSKAHRYWSGVLNPGEKCPKYPGESLLAQGTPFGVSRALPASISGYSWIFGVVEMEALKSGKPLSGVPEGALVAICSGSYCS